MLPAPTYDLSCGSIFMIASCVERHGFVMNVDLRTFELINFVVFAQFFD